MKSILARATWLALISSFAVVSTGRSHAAEQHILTVKSICAGIRRLGAANLLKFSRLFLDESPFAAITGHFEVVATLNRCGARALVKCDPNYVNKYTTDYLAKSFNKRDRREILQFHHRFLAERLSELFYEDILDSNSDRTLWTEILGGNRYAISISFNAKDHYEGDISLTFDLNDVSLYELFLLDRSGKCSR